VELGTDAACDQTLRGLDKPFLWTAAESANTIFAEAKLPCANYIIFGGPGETNATVVEGLANLRKLEYAVVFAFSGLRIFPGSSLHERAIQDGIISRDRDLFKPVFYISPEVDKAAMEAQLIAAWDGQKNRIFPPEEGALVIATLRSFGWQGLLWDKLVNFRRGKRA